MFYPQQFVAYPEQYQYQQQQEEQQRLEIFYKQQLLHNQSFLLSTPPPSPMATALGHPNRSCASCKKRKVKCDRKTPSCTACQKSKHRCHYTSYSPQVLTEEPHQADEDDIKNLKLKVEEVSHTGKLRWDRIQKMMYQQPPMAVKDEFANPSAPPYYIEDDDFYNLNLNNPVLPATSAGTTSQFALPQTSPHQIAHQQHQHQQQQLRLSPQQQLQMAQQQQQSQQVAYILPPQQYQHPNSAGTTPFVQAQNVVNYSPYMKGTIVLNYNLSGMAPLLGRQMAPILQSMTTGNGQNIPHAGFVDACHLQAWLREKFLSQDWKEEMEAYNDSDERFELRPIFEEVINQQLQQKFEVILQRVDPSSSSPSSVHGGDFQTYNNNNDYEDKHNMEMENLTNYSETGSNRSSVTDMDSTDVFLNKIYAFVRRFIRNHPWLRENFMSNLRAKTSPLGLDTFPDGVFSDVVVEVRKISSYVPPYHQDLKLIPNQEEFIKGRLFF